MLPSPVTRLAPLPHAGRSQPSSCASRPIGCASTAYVVATAVRRRSALARRDRPLHRATRTAKSRSRAIRRSVRCPQRLSSRAVPQAAGRRARPGTLPASRGDDPSVQPYVVMAGRRVALPPPSPCLPGSHRAYRRSVCLRGAASAGVVVLNPASAAGCRCASRRAGG